MRRRVVGVIDGEGAAAFGLGGVVVVEAGEQLRAEQRDHERSVEGAGGGVHRGERAAQRLVPRVAAVAGYAAPPRRSRASSTAT